MDFSTQAIQIINAVCEKFGVVVDWSQQNVLPYLQDLCTRVVHYGQFNAIYHMVFWLILFVVAFFIAKASLKHLKKIVDSDFDFNELTFTISIMGLIGSCVVMLVAFFCFFDWVSVMIEISFLPEKYFMTMLKGVTA